MAYKLIIALLDRMVEKHILKLDTLEFVGGNEMNSQISFLLDTNKSLQDLLIQYKNKITPFYISKKWDRYKKLSNEYECVFMTPHAKHNVSTFSPISRSYFKMWEIIHDFKDDIEYMVDDNLPLKCLFLAEGPGGFLEAVMRKRNNKTDAYYGFTLKPEHKSIPDWKLNSFTKNQLKQIQLIYGKDGTGNLYNLENADYIAQQLQPNSMHLITADGGFDFSANFNNQEQQSFRLVCCEIYCAFKMLKQNGTFIIKVYDMFNSYTLHIITILRMCFANIYITKPLTSRPANSEKYLVCCNFDVDKSKQYIEELIQICSGTFNDYKVDAITLNDIVMYNTFITCRQVVYIQKTIDIIHMLEIANTQEKNDLINNTIEHNKSICAAWCSKYDVPFTL